MSEHYSHHIRLLAMVALAASCVVPCLVHLAAQAVGRARLVMHVKISRLLMHVLSHACPISCHDELVGLMPLGIQ